MKSLPTSLPDDTLEDGTAGKNDPTWLRQAVEREAEFSDARIKLTGKLLRNVFALLLVACALYSGHGYSHGHVDTGPLMGCLLLPPLMEYNRRWPHDRRLRQGCVVMMTAYLHLRLWPGHLLISEWWPVPPTVKEGYPLPYSLLAPSVVLMVGSSLGLRIVPDLLVWAISVSLAGPRVLCVWITDDDC